jgi:hypothetical protein
MAATLVLAVGTVVYRGTAGLNEPERVTVQAPARTPGRGESRESQKVVKGVAVEEPAATPAAVAPKRTSVADDKPENAKAPEKVAETAPTLKAEAQSRAETQTKPTFGAKNVAGYDAKTPPPASAPTAPQVAQNVVRRDSAAVDSLHRLRSMAKRAGVAGFVQLSDTATTSRGVSMSKLTDSLAARSLAMRPAAAMKSDVATGSKDAAVPAGGGGARVKCYSGLPFGAIVLDTAPANSGVAVMGGDRRMVARRSGFSRHRSHVSATEGLAGRGTLRRAAIARHGERHDASCFDERGVSWVVERLCWRRTAAFGPSRRP